MQTHIAVVKSRLELPAAGPLVGDLVERTYPIQSNGLVGGICFGKVIYPVAVPVFPVTKGGKVPVGIVYLSGGQFQLIAGLEVEGHGGGVAVHIIALHGAELIGNILGSDLAGRAAVHLEAVGDLRTAKVYPELHRLQLFIAELDGSRLILGILLPLGYISGLSGNGFRHSGFPADELPVLSDRRALESRGSFAGLGIIGLGSKDFAVHAVLIRDGIGRFRNFRRFGRLLRCRGFTLGSFGSGCGS